MTQEGFRRNRIVLWALIGVQLTLIGAVALGWRQSAGGARAPLVRLETDVPPGIPLTLESGFDGALRHARAWAQDAFLFSAGMQVDWPTDPVAASASDIPGTGWVIYTFASATKAIGPGGKAATLSLLVDRMSGVVIDEREMGWTWQPRRTAAVTTYPISSLVALVAAETTVGNGYRNACPQFRHLSRLSIVPALVGSGATWLVTYEDSRAAGRPALTVRVDALSGEVEREDVAIGTGPEC